MKAPPLVLLTGLISAASTVLCSEPRPLPRAHAHNDYEHTRPLFDALDHGFCSVEADVWLIEGELRVAHDLRDARPGRTLQKLYLDPLRERVQRNGGSVFRGVSLFTLLIDVKSDATNTYRAIEKALRPYQSILSRFETGRTQTRPLTIIISGNRARSLMESQSIRWAGYDGRLGDLETTASPQLIPLISDNWVNHFRWKAETAEGPLPDAERQKLRQLVRQTHEQGRRLRFWGTPDKAEAWKELVEAGVDLINTDDLPGLAEFFARRPYEETSRP